MIFQFPKCVDRLETGLSEKINEFKTLVELNCPNFNEIFCIVPAQHSIWIETYDLGLNHWNGKRTKISDRGIEFNFLTIRILYSRRITG